MKVEIINTGSELLLGRTLNTHQRWLSSRLSELGYSVARQVTVADTGDAICGAVKEALARADVVVTTGGLGPTSDDLTREMIAGMLRRPLREDPDVLARLRQFYAKRNRTMPKPVVVQALVPDGAIVLENAMGTAPGLAIELDPNPYRSEGRRSLLILLPGPPRELRPMFDGKVIPLLRERFPPLEPFQSTQVRTTGLAESVAQARIQGPLAELVTRGLEVGYCARPGEVDVRLSGRGVEAARIVAEAADIVRGELRDEIYTEADEELEAAIVRLLAEQRKTLACAESCTGGLIGDRITNVSGASAVFLASLVTYSNEAKRDFLGVESVLLETHGAVSEPVCAAMAEGVRRRIGADFGLAVTGIAGPTGGSPEKPVGTVFIGIADAQGAHVERRNNRWDRLTFKRVTSQQALDLVRRRMLGLPLA